VSTSTAAAAATVSELAATNANTLVVVSGQAALNSLITSNQPGVFEGANVTINLEEQNFNTTNQVTSTINSPSGSTGEIQYNSGANSFASDPYFTYTNSNVITPGIRTNSYLYANGAPFLAGGNAAIGNFVFTGDTMTISDSNQTMNITGNGTGNINVTANGNTWTFGNNRILTLPGGPRIVPVDANLELQAASGGYAAITTSDGNSTVDVDGSGAHIVTSGINTWTFDNVGNLILPGNTFAVKYANGDTVAISTGGFPLANGTSNIDIVTANGNVTVTANGSSTWTFNTDGNLTLPTAGNIVGAVNIIGNGTSNVNVIANSRAWTFAADGNLVLPLAGNIVNYGNTWNFGYDGNLTVPGSINLGSASIWKYSNTVLTVTANLTTDTNGVSFEDGVDTNLYANANVIIQTDTGGAPYTWTFDNSGVLTTPGLSGDITGANLIGTVSISASGNIFGNNINSNYDLSAFGNVIGNSVLMNYLVSSANLAVSGTANVGALSTVGSVSANGNITTLSAMYSGNGATWQSQVSLANVLFVGADVAEAYVQAAMINTGGNGSSDWVSYSNNGNTDQGWIDMGVTGNTFSDPEYELTDPNDGYILVQGTDISGTPLGGNLILATGNTGLAHDIVFATGGFTHANIKARLINTTGEFSVVGNIVANNLSATNLVINSITSDDSTFVTIEDGLNVTSGLISAPANIALTAGSNDWTFGADGNLTLPSSLIVPANSIITGVGASPAPSINGFNNIDAIAFSASGNVTANNISLTGNGFVSFTSGSTLTFGDTPVTNRYYVDATRTGETYVRNGSQARPFNTIAAAQSAIATAIAGGLNPEVEPIYIMLLSNITENVTLATNHVYLVGQNGQIHQPIILTGNVIVQPTSGTLNSNHFSMSGIEVVGGTNGKAIYVTGTFPTRLSLQDMWITANGNSGAGLYQDNSGTGTYTHGGPIKVSHNGTGDVYCFDIRAGTASFESVETSGATQVGAAGPGATLTFNNSQLDANGDVVVETYGNGVVVVTNSVIKNSAANSYGIKLNAVANVAGTVSVGQSAFNVPVGTGQAVWLDPNTTPGLSGVFAWSGASFYPNTNTTIAPLVIPGPLAVLVGTIASPILYGDITSYSVAQDWDLIDNNASALSFDTTGKAGVLELVTTNSAEGVKMSGFASVAGNVTSGNILTGGLISATGNVTANNGMFTTIVNTASFTGGLVSVSGNVTSGNILTGGLISATANITGGNISTAGLVNTGSFVTGTIPAAAGAGAGSRAFVTDADSITFGNLYVGGSGNAMPVWSNGTSWFIG
jgi:hypothetical protein